MLRFFLIAFCVGAIKAAPVLEDSDTNPGELGTPFEGDMMLNEEQIKAITVAVNSKNGLVDPTQRWPAQTVVYHINGAFGSNQIAMIQRAMEYISQKTCIKFRPRSGAEHSVSIENHGSGCFAHVGYDVGQPQQLNLDSGCFLHGIIVHEMLHTIGFYHMQSTFDRDTYVKILWQNIIPGREHNFLKYSSSTVTAFGVPYDYGSLMHYGGLDFTSNNQPTIVPLQPGAQIGQRIGMSQSDIIKINKMYCGQ